MSMGLRHFAAMALVALLVSGCAAQVGRGLARAAGRQAERSLGRDAEHESPSLFHPGGSSGGTSAPSDTSPGTTVPEPKIERAVIGQPITLAGDSTYVRVTPVR